MANEQVSIRLTTQGGEQILRVLEQIGAAAQTQFRKAATEARDFSRVASDLSRMPVPQTAMQVTANAFAGVSPRVSAQQTEERGSDFEAAIGDAEKLRAKYAPLFAVERQHLQSLGEIEEAVRKGAIAHSDAATAVDRLSASYEKNRAAMVAEAQAPLNARLGVRDDFDTERRASDVAAYGAELDRLRASYSPLFALEQRHLVTLGEIADAARKGAIGHSEAAAAADRLAASYERQRNVAVTELQAPLNARLGVRDDFDTERRGSDVAAYGAELDRLRASYSPLFALEQRHLVTLGEIADAARKGAIGHSEAAAAADRLAASYERQRNVAVTELQAPLNARLGVRDDFDTERRASDVAAYGAELDRLEAKHAPLRTAKKALADDLKEIERIRATVGLSQAEVDSAVSAAHLNYTHRAKAIADTQKEGGGAISRWNLIDLRRQVEDVFVSLQGGQSPINVLAQQGPQIFDIFDRQEGGAGAAAKRFGENILRYVVNPVALLTAGFVGLTYAAYRYADQQETLNRALNGMGRASGASPEQLRSVAAAASRSGALSQGQSIVGAAQYAQAGIGIENIPTLLADTRRYSHAFGMDMDAAQKEIASIVGDEGLGAFERRFGAVSAATRAWITDLERSGRFAEAASVKTALLHAETQKATDAAGPLTKTSEWLASIPGDAANGAALLTRAVVDGLAPTSRRVELARPAPAPIGPAMGESISDYERRLGLSVEPSAAQRERRLAELSRGSKLAADIVDRYAPEEEQRRGLRRDLGALTPFTDSADGRAALGERADSATSAVADLSKALAEFETPAQKMRRDSDLAAQSIGAYSFEQRKALAEEQAYRQTWLSTQKEVLAGVARESAGNAILAESRRRLDDLAREADDRAQARGLSPLQAAFREIETRFARLREQLGPESGERLAGLQRQARLDLVSQTSFQALDAARPDLAERRQIAETRAALNELLSDPDGLSVLGDRADEARQAVGNLDNRLAVWRTSVQTIALDASLAARATEAYTFGQRELVAQQQAWLTVMRQSGDAAQAAAAAEKTRIEMIAQGNRAADDILRSAKDQADLIGLDPIQADLKRNEQNYRRFIEQNAPGRDDTQRNVERFSQQYLAASPQERQIETALAPMRTGFESAGEAARRLADALTGAAGRIASGAAPVQGAPPAFAGSGNLSDPRGVSGYIRERASAYGLNPDAVLRIAQSEGLSQFYGDKGTSFGALQLHIGGGLGDTFRKQTGLDPSDPRNERMTIDWGLRYMAQTRDVSPWHGAARVGVTNADVFGSSAPPSRVEPEARQALGLQNSVTLWGHLGSQIQSLDKDMQGHIALIDAQRGALTADEATLQGVVAAQQLANRFTAEGADVEKDSALVKRDGVLTTMRLKDAIIEHGLAAEEAARKEEENARARRRYIGELDLVRGAVSDTGSSVLKAAAHGENVGDAARNALRSAGDRAIDFGWNTITENLFGPQGSANLGLFGDILGLGGKDKTTQQMNVKSGVVYVSGAGGLPSVGGAGGFLEGLFGGSNSNFAGQAAGAIGPFQQSGGSFLGDLFSGIGSLFGFAEGGMMTSAGAAPLHRYERGGVADRPQLALFGEGSHPEAYIPMTDRRGLHVVVGADGKAHVALPDGRGIPALIEGRERLDIPGGASLASNIRLSAFADGGMMTSAGPAPLSYVGSPSAPASLPPLRMSSPSAVAAATSAANAERRPIEVKVMDGRGGNKVEVAYATHNEVMLMISANNQRAAEAQQFSELKGW